MIYTILLKKDRIPMVKKDGTPFKDGRCKTRLKPMKVSSAPNNKIWDVLFSVPDNKLKHSGPNLLEVWQCTKPEFIHTGDGTILLKAETDTVPGEWLLTLYKEERECDGEFFEARMPCDAEEYRNYIKYLVNCECRRLGKPIPYPKIKAGLGA